MKIPWVAYIAAMLLVAPLFTDAHAEPDNTIDVFFKNKPPSLKTLEKVKTILEKYRSEYTITYYLITDPANGELIRKYEFPETHFPFAVVINGKHAAMIDKKVIHFFEFPLFMKGIGRHEGNWSMDDLGKVLQDNTLLLDKNVLPASVHGEEDDEPCPGE